MRKIFCAVLALVMVVFLPACKQNPQQPTASQQTPVGEWSATVDMTEVVNRMVYAQTGASTVSVAFPVILELSIRADGTYSVKPNRTELDKQIDTLGTVLWQIVVDQAAAQSHLTPTETVEAMKNQGKTKDVLMEQLDLASMFENSCTETGVWAQDENNLYFATESDDLPAMEGYRFALEGDALILTYVQVLDEAAESTEKTIVFNRA